MLTSFFLIARISLAWGLAVFFVMIALAQFVFRTNTIGGGLELLPLMVALFAVMTVFSHISRVRLIATEVNAQTLSNRQRRTIEIPFDANAAFALLEAAVRELPGVLQVDSAADSLQLRAKIKRVHPYRNQAMSASRLLPWLENAHNQILITVSPGTASCTATAICEPDRAAWVDTFLVDNGTNLEIAEALVRAISQRIVRS